MSSLLLRSAVACAFGTVVSLSGWPAAAFFKACHQDITTEALDRAAWPSGARPPQQTDEQARLRNEVTIDLAPRVTDFWSMSMLIGNQFNDGGSFDESDLVARADDTARSDQQRLHCLRAADDDGPDGDRRALAACKAFMLEQIGVALGDGDVPDLAVTDPIRLHLVFRGDADVPVARYAFHMGQAVHAMQDAFTHAFRSSDMRHVRSVLNWVDWVRGSGYDPARDGFQHILALDNCGPSDPGGPERRAAALQATSELLAAVADDGGGRAGRLGRASAVIDAWSGIDEVCTAENRWCDAPEQKLASAAGCALAPSPRRPSSGSAAVTILGMAMVAGWRSRAAADRGAEPDRGEHKGGLVAKATAEEQKELASHPFGVLVGSGLSIDNAGWNIAVGARYDLGPRFTVGATVEWSPWFSIQERRTAAGTTDVFGVGIYRLDVRDYLELRLTVSAGASILMYDTFAARQGSVGPYFALSPLGVAFRMGSHLRLIVDPAEIAIAIPKTTGIPLAYREHRFSVAVQANF